MITLPTIQGVISRRILANYRADPEVVEALLPERFTPKLYNGYAIAGICLIRLQEIRPLHTPSIFGISSENAAHRIAVNWRDDDGSIREGVFIPRRDTDSGMNHWAGGHVFPGEHHLANFDVSDDGENIGLNMLSRDGTTRVSIQARAAKDLPKDSIFESIGAASSYFEGGSVGYSVTHDETRLDGIELETKEWHVEPLAVAEIYSSFYDDPQSFPKGSINFDHALIMRDISHEWHGHKAMSVDRKSRF